MASSILASATEKVHETLGDRNKKVADLTAATKDVHDKSHRITTDYGVKQTNTDHWLSVTSEDQQGPLLLEDSHAREKVCSPKSEKKGITKSLTGQDPS